MRTTKLALLATAAAFCASTAWAQSGTTDGVRQVAHEYNDYYAAQPPVPPGVPSDSPSDPGADLPVDPAPAPYHGGSGCVQPGCAEPSCDFGCADTYCQSCCSDCSCHLFGPEEAWTVSSGENCLGLKVGGWVQLGYHSDQTPLSRNFGDLLSFNDVPDGLRNHQSWMYFERALDTDACCWDWGFRADFMYGTDAQKTQAFGGPPNSWDNPWDHGIYGFALPQLYAEVGRGDLSVKFGHFFTLVGYEVVGAPGNFFYSHAYTMFNSEPFTHTGAVATYSVCDGLEVYGGWTQGWDTGFSQLNNGSNFIGGFSKTLMEDITLTYITTVGNFGARGDDGYSHSVVADFTLTEKLNYVLQSDLVRIDSVGDDDVGINQYLFYTYNDCVKFGVRAEWWKDDGVSHQEVTGGVNIRPHANLVVRPEIRKDWSNGNNIDETTFGVDAILTF